MRFGTIGTHRSRVDTCIGIGSFVPSSDARLFLIQREKVCIYLARLGCVYVLLMTHVP